MGVSAVVGGWYYAYNLAVYGYVYPHQLDAHAVMAIMPPGSRTLLDYLWIPPATLWDPRLRIRTRCFATAVVVGRG